MIFLKYCDFMKIYNTYAINYMSAQRMCGARGRVGERADVGRAG
jgi:hypothetical protein